MVSSACHISARTPSRSTQIHFVAVWSTAIRAITVSKSFSIGRRRVATLLRQVSIYRRSVDTPGSLLCSAMPAPSKDELVGARAEYEEANLAYRAASYVIAERLKALAAPTSAEWLNEQNAARRLMDARRNLMARLYAGISPKI